MKISLERYATALYSIGKEEKKSERALKLKTFVEFLARKKKLSSLPRILEIYSRTYNKKEHIADLTTYTAHALPASVLTVIQHMHKGATLEHQNSINPHLIGGIVFKINDDIIDRSIAGTLNQLQRRLSLTN